MPRCTLETGQRQVTAPEHGTGHEHEHAGRSQEGAKGERRESRATPRGDQGYPGDGAGQGRQNNGEKETRRAEEGAQGSGQLDVSATQPVPPRTWR